jgi:hypothetical protein
VLTTQIADLESALADRFEQHPDAVILRSLAGLGIILGARVLAEFGDDPNRYEHAKARKNYAGTSPITRQFGKRKTVLARYTCNRRLADALTWWAFSSLTASPGARAFYDRRRAAGDGHHQALRVLANRWVGILHGCLRHRTEYDEATAWPGEAVQAISDAVDSVIGNTNGSSSASRDRSEPRDSGDEDDDADGSDQRGCGARPEGFEPPTF